MSQRRSSLAPPSVKAQWRMAENTYHYAGTVGVATTYLDTLELGSRVAHRLNDPDCGYCALELHY